MNKTIITILGVLTLAAMPAMAVPSGINYQGALTDDQGNPVTGTREMSIKLYDAATGGTLLYSEDIGAVDVSDGVFSFEFGTSGSSNAEQSDTVAISNGTATTFQKVLSASEVVAGSVSVTDGTYTWSQSGGSSNEDNFGVAYSTSLRRVTVTYYNGAPAAGRTITATYRTPASGISGALAGDNQPWAEIAVDGVVQVPRQKVLAVPFAAVSQRALLLEPQTETLLLPIAPFGRELGNAGTSTTNYVLPAHLTRIEGGSFKYILSRTAGAPGSTSEGVSFNLTIREINPIAQTSTVLFSHNDQIWFPELATRTNTVYLPEINLDTSTKFYSIDVSISNSGASNWGSRNSGTFHFIKVDHTRQ